MSYVKFSAKAGWNLDGGPQSRLEVWVWQRENKQFLMKSCQPEDYIYAPCYLCVGMLEWCCQKRQVSINNCDAASNDN